MTVPNIQETAGERIHRQIAAIRSQGGTDEDVAAFLTHHPEVQNVNDKFSDVQGGSSSADAPPPRGSFLAPIAKGATLGGSDEILGAIEGANQALPKILGGRGMSVENFKQGYSEGKAKTLAVGDQFQRDNPKTSAALEVAGSIPTIVATGGTGGSALLQGAKYGAISGALSSEGGATERAKGAAKGGVIGAVAGPVVEGGAKLATAGARVLRIPQIISRGASAVADQLPAGNAQGKLRTLSTAIGAEGQASKQIAKRIESEGTTPAGLAKASQLRTGISGEKPEIAADLSPELASLTKSVTKEPGKGRALINKVLTNRAAGTRDRLAADIGRPSSVKPQIEDMVRQREASAATHFADAYKAGAGGLDDPALSDLMQRPTVKALWRDAQKMAADDGAKLPTKTVEVIPPATGDATSLDPKLWADLARKNGLVKNVEVPIPDVRAIHYMDQVLREQVDNGVVGKGAIKTPGHALALQNVIKQIRDRVAQHVPEFDNALADYAGRSSDIEALKTGTDILKYIPGVRVPGMALGKGDPLALKAARQGIDGLEAAVHNMTPPQRALFRQGALASVRDAIEKVPATVDGSTTPVLRRIFSDSPQSARWQRLLFDNPQDAAAFQQALKRERGMAATKARMGGSDTAENLAEKESRASGLRLIQAVKHPLSAASAVVGQAAKGNDVAVNAALGRRLSASGSRELAKMLADQEKEQALQASMGKTKSIIRNALAAKATR